MNTVHIVTTILISAICLYVGFLFGVAITLRKLQEEVDWEQVPEEGTMTFFAKVKIIYKDWLCDSIELVPGTTFKEGEEPAQKIVYLDRPRSGISMIKS